MSKTKLGFICAGFALLFLRPRYSVDAGTRCDYVDVERTLCPALLRERGGPLARSAVHTGGDAVSRPEMTLMGGGRGFSFLFVVSFLCRLR